MQTPEMKKLQNNIDLLIAESVALEGLYDLRSKLDENIFTQCAESNKMLSELFECRRVNLGRERETIAPLIGVYKRELARLEREQRETDFLLDNRIPYF